MKEKLEILDVDVGELRSRHSDGLAVIRGGEGHAGMVIRNVFPRSTMECVVERLMRGECRIDGRPSPYYVGRTFGRILPREGDASLEAYFDEASIFRAESLALFRGFPQDFQTRLEEVLGMMAGGRDVRVPRDSADREYQAYSIREMLPGGEIDLHYENEAFDSPAMAEMKSMIDRNHQMSTYVALQVPEAGGELSLYALGEGDPESAELMMLERKSARVYTRIEEMAPRCPLLAGVGDMLLFDAGRYFHRVTRVEGTRARWTMGCLVTLSRDGGTYYYFA